MPARIDQPTRPGWRFWLLWMLATAAGAAAGMVFSAPLQLILEAAVGNQVPPPWTATQTVLIVLLKGGEGGMMGLGMGLGQWWVFRRHLKQMGGWIAATGLALFLQDAFRWSLPYDTPPSQVLVITTLSFGLFLGLCQWFVLRRHVTHAGWWIAVSIAGWVAAFAVGSAGDLAQFSIESILGMVFLALSMLVPFAVAGGGMVWLLRRNASASHAISA